MPLTGSITNYFYINKGTTQGTISRTTDATKAHYSLTFEWEVLSQSVVTNQSTIKWALKAKAINFAGVDRSYSYNYSFTTLDKLVFGTDAITYGEIDEQGNYMTYPDLLIKLGSETILVERDLNEYLYSDDVEEDVVIAEGTSAVTHDVDGKYNVDLSATIRTRNGYDSSGQHLWHNNGVMDAGQYSKHTVAGTVTIRSITRRAFIKSAPLNFTDEDSPAIEYSVPPTMTGYIYLSLDGADTTETTHLQAVTGEGTHNYTFTEDDLAKLWAIQNQGLLKTRVKFFIKTTTAADNLTFREGTDWLNFEVINYLPEFEEPEVYDTNQDCIDRLTGSPYTLVKYVSNAYFKTGAKGNKGATIETQTVRNGDTTLDGPTGTFNKVVSNEFHFAATDNYGRSVQETMQFAKLTGFIDYVKLTCSVRVTEMTAEGVATVKVYGKFYDGTFGNVKNKQNRLRVNYDLYTNGSDDFDHKDIGYADLELDGSTWSVSGTDYEYIFTIDGLDYQSYYTIAVRVSDEVATEGVAAQTLLAATPIFDWGRRDFNFNVPVTIQGWEVDRVVDESYEEPGYYLNANGIASNGNFTWSFRKWSSGLMECWCSKNISVSFPSSWGSGLAVTGRILQTNLIYPRTFIDTPVVTATLSSGYAGGILMSTGSSSVPTDEYSTGTLEIARGGSTTTSTYNYTINYMVKGRWK